MTFTRKAAAEMRNRIIDALVDAEIEMPDADSLTLATRALARQVRERDRALGWNLVAHPAQLRIYTIDAFCASLARQAPVTTRFGAPPRIDDETLRLYEEAVRAALIAADPADTHWRTVLDHVDNDTTNAVQLLVDLLAKRDQWLKHLVGRDETTLRSAAEATLVAEIESELVRARSLFPVDLLPELALLLSYAARNLASMPERLEWCRRIEDCVACGGLPDAKAGAIAHWQTLAECLLTQKGGWRSKFEVGDGFPPKGSGPGAAERDAFKARMTTLVDTCASVLGLREALAVVRRLPPATFDDASWRVVASMQALLPRLAAQLKVTFAEAGVIDPTEAMITAIDVLGTPDGPSDLLLRLDLSIAHLLIDEFQDTSDAQGALFERLTAGWIPGDGRTVFAVGDPMQSIYRFREAEVRLFLEARERLRIGNVPLTFIDLTRNFRSQARIVSWVNDTFPRVFAERDDPWRSAVAYARSVAARPAIAIEPTFDLYADSEMEAAAVIARVQGVACGERITDRNPRSCAIASRVDSSGVVSDRHPVRGRRSRIALAAASDSRPALPHARARATGRSAGVARSPARAMVRRRPSRSLHARRGRRYDRLVRSGHVADDSRAIDRERRRADDALCRRHRARAPLTRACIAGLAGPRRMADARWSGVRRGDARSRCGGALSRFTRGARDRRRS
jgi:ATP-dependent exoDNAse (exonuclease V) beta subunit